MSGDCFLMRTLLHKVRINVLHEAMVAISDFYMNLDLRVIKGMSSAKMTDKRGACKETTIFCPYVRTQGAPHRDAER